MFADRWRPEAGVDKAEWGVSCRSYLLSRSARFRVIREHPRKAFALFPAQSEHRQGAFADAALPVDQAHAQFRARVTTRVAVAHLTGHPFRGVLRGWDRQRRGQ